MQGVMVLLMVQPSVVGGIELSLPNATVSPFEVVKSFTIKALLLSTPAPVLTVMTGVAT